MHRVPRLIRVRKFVARLIAFSAVASTVSVLAVAFQTSSVLAATFNDPLIEQQWGLTAIGAPNVWNISRGAGVTVAVIDSGSGPHPDLDANLDAGRTMFGSIDSPGMIDVDPKGHGTHVAGIIAAAVNNGIGGAGVAPQARIMPIRVLAADGSGISEDVTKAVRYAVDNGAKVINLSLGGSTESTPLTSAIQYAVDHNVLVVAAAGNGGPSSTPKWPASSDLAIAVTAIDRTNGVARFDQRGDYIDLAAPGVSILSTKINDYAEEDGTSMAAAFVTGAAALLFAAQPSITAAQVRDILQRTATDIGALGRDSTFGYGVINLVAAFAELEVLFPKVVTASIATEGRVGSLALGASTTTALSATSQWFRCSSAGEATKIVPADCEMINNAVATAYQSTVRDLRKFLRYSITIVNGTSTTTSYSATSIPESGAWMTTSLVAAKSTTPINQILESPSKGVRSIKVLNGSCKVRNSKIIAPSIPGSCTLKISVAAKAPFPELGFTTIITVA
jgi:hypothetical protein